MSQDSTMNSPPDSLWAGGERGGEGLGGGGGGGIAQDHYSGFKLLVVI